MNLPCRSIGKAEALPAVHSSAAAGLYCSLRPCPGTRGSVSGQVGSCVNHTKGPFTSGVGGEGTHLSVTVLPRSHRLPGVMAADMDVVGRTDTGCYLESTMKSLTFLSKLPGKELCKQLFVSKHSSELPDSQYFRESFHSSLLA